MKSILKKLKKPFRNFRKAFYILILNFILLILSNLLDMVIFSCKKKKQNDDNYFYIKFSNHDIKNKNFSYRIKNKISKSTKTSLLKQMGRKIIFFILKNIHYWKVQKNLKMMKKQNRKHRSCNNVKITKTFSIIKN